MRTEIQVFVGGGCYGTTGMAFRCERFQPFISIIMQSPFIVYDEDIGGDVHRVYKGKLVSLYFYILNGGLMFIMKKAEKNILYNIDYKVYTIRKDFAWDGQ